MTKEQKIELDKLSTYLNYAKTDNLEEVIVSTKTIETVLNILKEKIAEVEIHTGLEHFYKKEDLDKLELLREANAKIKEKDKEIEKKDKQIDLMAEIFYKRFKAELLLEYGFESEEQLKQYFAGLVEKE